MHNFPLKAGRGQSPRRENPTLRIVSNVPPLAVEGNFSGRDSSAGDADLRGFDDCAAGMPQS
ncbi:MAG TPA: hypothetical protein VMP01_12365, partial [Pirellulaceae bacterium]|nr:hypothetical protein [Pirellulaceae bacterium]